MRHYLLVKALFTSWRFFKMAPMNVVLMFYTFGEIKLMKKTALIHSPKTLTSFDVKLIQDYRSSPNLLNTSSLLKTYE